MALTKDQIIVAIATRGSELSTVELPEWGGTAYLRRLTIEDAEETGLLDGRRDKATIINVIAASLCDEEGTILFDDDTSALVGIDMSVLTRIFTEALSANGLLSDSLEEAVAGFADAQPGSSSSS